MNDTKTYTVRFLPNDELEYEFVVEAESAVVAPFPPFPSSN